MCPCFFAKAVLEIVFSISDKFIPREKIPTEKSLLKIQNKQMLLVINIQRRGESISAALLTRPWLFCRPFYPGNTKLWQVSYNVKPATWYFVLSTPDLCITNKCLVFETVYQPSSPVVFSKQDRN